MGYIKDPPGLVFNAHYSRPLTKPEKKLYKEHFENEVRKMLEKEAKKKYHASENPITMVSEPESEFKVKKSKIKKKRNR